MTEPRRTYQPTAQEVTLRAWVRLVAGSWDTSTHTYEVAYANDRGSRPKPPYATIQVIAERPTGRPARHTSDTVSGSGVEAYAQTHYVATCSVNLYGENHRTVARALVASLERDDVIELTTNDELHLGDVVDGISDNPTALDTQYEPRSRFDVRFAFSVRHTFEAEPVESIAGDVEVDTFDGRTVTSPFAAP